MPDRYAAPCVGTKTIANSEDMLNLGLTPYSNDRFMLASA